MGARIWDVGRRKRPVQLVEKGQERSIQKVESTLTISLHYLCVSSSICIPPYLVYNSSHVYCTSQSTPFNPSPDCSKSRSFHTYPHPEKGPDSMYRHKAFSVPIPSVPQHLKSLCLMKLINQVSHRVHQLHHPRPTQHSIRLMTSSTREPRN